MKKIILLSLVFIFLSEAVSAQYTDSLRNVYNNQTILRYGGYFLKGTERLTFQQLSREFSMSDLGLAGYEKAKRYRTTSTILRWAGLVAGIAGVAVLANNPGNNTYYYVLGGQFLLTIGSGSYALLSAQSLDRALWQRNKDLLFPK